MSLALIEEAMAAGSSLEAACKALGVSLRTVQRWRGTPAKEDQRAGPKHRPAHALSASERKRVLEVATSPEYRNLSVRQVVPLLADRGEYVASEATFYRVLAEDGLGTLRGHARPPSSRRPPCHVASAPNQVWCWDITYLRAPVKGTFFYLYLIVDLYSRKVVACDVRDEESMDYASELAKRAAKAENAQKGLTLHSDNGGPMKGSTMLATLHRLGIIPSFSRPAVSDDNAFCEALFRTLKYRPGYPRKPFPSLEAARAWVDDFVRWYNGEHLHSAIRHVTPSDRHEGRDGAILANRRVIYAAARERAPRRWTGPTRNWTPAGPVALNPERLELVAA